MKTITKTVFKVGDFVSWAKSGQLDLRPKFQRRPVWKSGAKSYLIDTIIRGLPIPIVFLRDRLEINSIMTSREVVDGQQRLRTILSYVSPSLLPDFDQTQDSFKITKTHNIELANKAFQDLPVDAQQAIIGYEIPVHVFSADTEDRDVLQIFARLNATGVKLNEQELRNAEYFGVFKSLCYSLAYENLTRWQEWGVFTLADISRMIEVEDVSDLIISMHEGVHGKSQKNINDYYEKFDANYPVKQQTERRFGSVMDSIESTIGKEIISTEFSRRLLFSDLFTATYELMYGLGSELKTSRKPNKLPSGFANKLRKISDQLTSGEVDENLTRSLRGATAHYGTRLERINFILGAFGYEIEEG